MGRTKRPKGSIKYSSSANDIFNRISIVASSTININDLEENVISTPVKKIKKCDFKQFLKEEDENILAFEKKFIDDINDFETSFAMIKLALPANLLNKPLKSSKIYRDLYAVGKIEEPIEEENIRPRKPSSASPFKKPEVLDVPQRSTIKKTSRKLQKTPVNQILCTPIAAVTPKVNMNQPLSVLRHARVGEQALSMSGSPIMVSSVPRGDVATVSVPLNDGKIVTILPSSDVNIREQMPSLDNETKEQLETLYRNLAVFFSSDDNEDSSNCEDTVE